MSISPMPLSDIEDDDGDDTHAPLLMPIPQQRHLNRSDSKTHNHRHNPNESISEIDMRQVLLGVDDDQELDDAFSSPPAAVPSRQPVHQHHHHHQKSLADPIDPETYPVSPLPTTTATPIHSTTTTTIATESRANMYGSSSSQHSKFSPSSPFSPSSSRLIPLPSTIADSYFPAPSTYAPAGGAARAGLGEGRIAENDPFPSSLSTTTQFSSSTYDDDARSPVPAGDDDSVHTPTTPASATRSPSIKDSRFGRRAERTRSEGLRRALNGRSRSRAAERDPLPEPLAELPPVPGASGGGTTTPTTPTVLDASPFSSARGLGLGLPSELGVIVVTKVVKTEVEEVRDEEMSARVQSGAGHAEMTLDELGVLETKNERQEREEREEAERRIREREETREKGRWPTKSRVIKRPHANSQGSVEFPVQSQKEEERSVSPDIAAILSKTPRPHLSKSTSAASGSRSRENSLYGSGARQRVKSHGSLGKRSIMLSGKRRVMSEGMGYPGPSSSSSSKDRSSWESVGRHSSRDEHDEELERVLEGQGSDDDDLFDAGGDGGESDSSIDLHTPLPLVFLLFSLISID